MGGEDGILRLIKVITPFQVDEYGFTCEFTTSVVGRHTIEIVIGGDRLNVTPDFYTYDASKIRVGDVQQPGYAGMPVEFTVAGKGAGLGNLEVIVNGGRVSRLVN